MYVCIYMQNTKNVKLFQLSNLFSSFIIFCHAECFLFENYEDACYNLNYSKFFIRKFKCFVLNIFASHRANNFSHRKSLIQFSVFTTIVVKHLKKNKQNTLFNSVNNLYFYSIKIAIILAKNSKQVNYQ